MLVIRGGGNREEAEGPDNDEAAMGRAPPGAAPFMFPTKWIRFHTGGQRK